MVGVQLEAAGGAAEGGLIRPAFRVDVAAGGAHLAGVARVHRDHHPPPLLPLGFEHGLDLPQAGIPEAATEHGLRRSLIRQEDPGSILGGLRLRPAGHAVVVQLLHRHRAVGPQGVGADLVSEALTGAADRFMQAGDLGDGLLPVRPALGLAGHLLLQLLQLPQAGFQGAGAFDMAAGAGGQGVNHPGIEANRQGRFP